MINDEELRAAETEGERILRAYDAGARDAAVRAAVGCVWWVASVLAVAVILAWLMVRL